MKIGITGSIACGKSTVLRHIKAQGYPVWEADAVSRSLTAPGGAALPSIRERFGDSVFQGDVLDRAALGFVVFRNPSERRALEGILHPLILAHLREWLEREDGKGNIVFAEVPLLYECHWERLFDAVWVVRADEATQIARLMARDGITEEAARARIAAQMSADQKAALADAVIDTDGQEQDTLAQADALLARITADEAAPRQRIRRKAVQITPSEAPHSSTLVTRFNDLPGLLRLLLSTLLVAALVLGSITITSHYFSHLEERRRLAAEAAERANHPLLYPELVTEYAELRSLDPALVSAIILCESSYDPKAVSRLGARGLMQLMEDTAGWVAHRLGEDAGYSFDNLFDPETNIRYGTWYLAFLARRFDEDPVKIVCSYHAGQGNVDAWLRNPEYSEDGIHLSKIPTDDTAQYCNRVLKARDIYEKYYFTKPEEPSEEESVVSTSVSSTTSR